MEERDRRILGQLTMVGDFQAMAAMYVARAHEFCAPKPFVPYLVYGVRTSAQQIDLFGKGRELRPNGDPTQYASWKRIPGSRIVTRALPQDAPHCHAAALDLALIGRASRAWLPDPHSAWGDLACIALELGLQSGHYWPRFKDSAHVELVGWREHAHHGLLKLIA